MLSHECFVVPPVTLYLVTLHTAKAVEMIRSFFVVGVVVVPAAAVLVLLLLLCCVVVAALYIYIFL